MLQGVPGHTAKGIWEQKNIPGKGEEKVSRNWNNSKTERLKEEGRTDKGRVGGNKRKQEEKKGEGR